MARPRLFGSAAFRLAAVYAVIFAVSAAGLLGAVYISVKEYDEARHRAIVQTQSVNLLREADEDGLEEILEHLSSQDADDQDRPDSFLLIGPDGKVMAGDVRLADTPPGLSHLTLVQDQGARLPMMAVRANVQGGVLVVASDIEDLRTLQREMLWSFAWAGGLTVILAIIGGAATSILFRSRIGMVTRTTRRIVSGELSERVPVSRNDDEFDRLAVDVNAMLDRIEGLMEGLRQVSNDVAHDLRTPLTRLRQRLEAVRSGPQDITLYQAALDSAVEDTDEILATFAALLRIAQIEAGARKAGFQRVDLSRVVGNVVEAFAPSAEDQGRELTASLEPHRSVAGDPELLTQLVSNLIENALRHTPEGTPIDVALSSSATVIDITVSDRGPGVPDAARGKVFRRFYRGDASRGSAGNGLGLALVAAIADLHSARIELSDNHPGLNVRVSFPALP
ncbi:sensor histidine kinase [Brevundimonas sp.]|uniref:sensor histidine kinase n=1 Tax=Brevundimonas sp. TaxID=1871086 RepID=UPI003D0BE6EF